ncbi:P-loop containing nucleoside triphosphate hydrolase protein [Podospora didyma]|uniref:P-loop containing nucleoside triphosphate hydrolase protein n=1 Tax=Podospora didyma TaxID=330526 RepID=A0AAE0KKM0_9PEZI|nr:P-loop containing nucleoside triphosphate hydrolase protein [Podospora didyma]
MEVHLLVYDLSRGMARQMSQGLLGFHLDAIYHTSIKLRDREYVYDGNIVAISPGTSHLGQPMQEIYLGQTELPMDVIEEYLDSLREIYTVAAYDLWRHNCNNFSNDFATFLLGKGIPGHITNMPQAVLDSPFGQMLLPMLNQQINASKRAGGILGSQDQTPGSSVKPQAQLHHHEGKVHKVSNLAELDALLAKFNKSCAVVFFTSATCRPCHMLYPMYDELAAEVGDKGILIKADTSKAFDVGQKYSVSATPTFITFLKGEQENRWSGADPGALRGNVQLLVQMAWPAHPHQSLNLPTFANPGTKPVLFEKVPPLPKLLAKMGATSQNATIQGVKHFIETRAKDGPAEASLPDMAGFTECVRESMEQLPVDVLFTVVDLLRCGLIDPRFSGYLAEEKEHHTLITVLNRVNGLETKDCPYALRLVTLQMACNLFSSPLYQDQILGYGRLRASITEMVSTSFLDDSHSNIRVAAASLLFNLSLANSHKRREGPGDLMPEGDQVELAASVLEAISQESSSADALEGMLKALGYLAYRLPLDGELAELLRMMDAEDIILAKKKDFPDMRLITEIGSELFGKGLKGLGWAGVQRKNWGWQHESVGLRFDDIVANIHETLTEIALEPRLMPNATTLDVTQRAIRSSASTPSLRSRDGTVPPHARMDPGGNVRVVVRVRAFLPREIERKAECLIKMDPLTQRTTLMVPDDTDPANARARSRKVVEEKAFTFDNSFWSHNPADEHYAMQEDVYDSLGEEFLDHNFEGYHTCIFAYGQTGSGKSYTMMGTAEQPGLIPRTCEDLFERIAAAQEETPNISYNVRVSYFEVYNEHVRDLLVPVVPNQPPYYLKIRESPTEGPYVKDLTEVPVRNINEILRHMRVGDASRTTASTKMNDTSSRSHSVFTIMLKQIHHDLDTDETTERSSRIRLVDLAGSERAKSTEATGQRLREGSNINKSLTTLGRVIAALADPVQKKTSTPQRGVKKGATGGTAIVPYRDSILTWLLKDSLGGNSKTAMIACIAPSDYEETLSTLRYADQAKRIRTRAVVNQDSISSAERDAQILAMESEIRALQLVVGDSRRREKDAREAEERLEEYQARVRGLQQLMEERSLVAEGKIRSLQTENEALRLHLKLAVASLKNPIPEVVVREILPPAEEVIDENMAPPAVPVGVGGDESFCEDDEDDGYASGGGDDEAFAGGDDMHEQMQVLLKDLNMFRRKIGDDKSRFLMMDQLERRKPLAERSNII